MTNEQLTQKVMELEEFKGQSTADHKRIEQVLAELQEDVRATKDLAEDVHIMAINMQNMQKTQDEMNKKVDALSSKEFLEYKENKKAVKSQIISILIGSIGTLVLGFIGWLFTQFMTKGGI